MNNTTFTNGAIENAKCGLIFAWPAWDSAANAYIETLRNSILENREGEIIHVWSAIYEDSTQEVDYREYSQLFVRRRQGD